MPLSEEELRLLEQMERALVAEDPKLASTLRGTEVRRHARRRVMLGALVFVVGVSMLMAGAILSVTPVGIAGFVVMLASAYFALMAWRGQSAAANAAEGGAEAGAPGLSVIQGGKSAKRSKGRSVRRNQPMMERLEERWRRRREQNGGM